MQNIKIPIIPTDLEITPSELDYLNHISEPLFLRLNNHYQHALLLNSDAILCIIILICRANNQYPENINILIPLILKHNISLES